VAEFRVGTAEAEARQLLELMGRSGALPQSTVREILGQPGIIEGEVVEEVVAEPEPADEVDSQS